MYYVYTGFYYTCINASKYIGLYFKLKRSSNIKLFVQFPCTSCIIFVQYHHRQALYTEV